MRAQDRLSDASVMQQLLSEPYRFRFDQAVRLLMRWLRTNGKPAERALSRILRFQNSLALTFPASEIEAVSTEPAEPDAMRLLHALSTDNELRIALTPAFFGLLGAQGALPLHRTERIAAAQRWDGDASGRAFIDLFSQRMTTLFFLAVGKYRLEQAFDTEGRDIRLPLLRALAGVRDSADGTGRIAAETPAYYAGLLRTRPVSAATAASLMADYFGVPVTIEPFVGGWDPVPDQLRSRTGSRAHGAGARLGHGAMLGSRLWRHDLRARVHIGPLAREQFERFLPGSTAAAQLHEMLALLGLPGLKFEVRLHLAPSASRRVVLTRRPEAVARLGWDATVGAGNASRKKTGYLLRAPAAHSHGARSDQ